MMKEAEPLVLAVDLGTSSVKVALITVHGRVLGWESGPLALHVTPDGGTEQSPREWWHVFLSTAQRLLARDLAPARSVRAVCCSTQGEGTVPVDREGRALMNGILWMDMRGAPYLHRQARGRVNLLGVDAARLLRWIRLTGGMPSPTGKDPAGHMLLVRDRFPEVYARTYKFLNVLDYMNLRLTGRFVATFDSILTSWVTDNRDPDDIRYDARLVRDSGIDADKFPEIVPCTEVLGRLEAGVAAALGLPAGVLVVAGSIDNTAAGVGAGAVEDFAPHLYIGTSSWLAAHVPFKKTDPLSSLASVPCAVPQRYLLTALQATAGGNLAFLGDNVLFPQDELSGGEKGPDLFRRMDRAAARSPAGSNGLLYTRAALTATSGCTRTNHTRGNGRSVIITSPRCRAPTVPPRVQYGTSDPSSSASSRIASGSSRRSQSVFSATKAAAALPEPPARPAATGMFFFSLIAAPCGQFVRSLSSIAAR